MEPSCLDCCLEKSSLSAGCKAEALAAMWHFAAMARQKSEPQTLPPAPPPLAGQLNPALSLDGVINARLCGGWNIRALTQQTATKH